MSTTTEYSVEIKYSRFRPWRRAQTNITLPQAQYWMDRYLANPWYWPSRRIGFARIIETVERVL